MKYYKITLSNKQEFELDEQDYQKVIAAVKNGGMVKTNNAIINTSFIVTIIPFDKLDSKKIAGYIDEATRTFIVTEESNIEPTIEDKFNRREPQSLLK